jgi:CMP-N-acetylneuraminic acid synthetase
MVTVYMSCRDYGEYVGRAIESVLAQSSSGWELIVVDDGSVDGSWEAISRYAKDERIRIVRHDQPAGLRATANECVAVAQGDWVMRLDADDRLHPLCLEILCSAVAQDPGVDLVFSDYYYIDHEDQVLAVECLPSSPTGYDVQTFPPHGACSLVRREALLGFGGYDEDISRQDGHELWLKLLGEGRRYRHVPLPLFFYRRHGDSLSASLTAVLEDRRQIKRKLADALEQTDRVVAVIAVKNTYPEMPDIPFRLCGGRPLIDSAIEEAAAVRVIGEIVVTTDDDAVVEYVQQHFPEVIALRRPPEICQPTTAMIDIMRSLVETREYDDDVVICLLSVHTPRRTSSHIQMALDTFWLYDVDSVVTVYEERGLIYQMGEQGLKAINPSNEDRVRLERDALYVDSGAIRVFAAQNTHSGRLLGQRIGHALVTPEDAAQITSPSDFHLLDPEVTPVVRNAGGRAATPSGTSLGQHED